MHHEGLDPMLKAIEVELATGRSAGKSYQRTLAASKAIDSSQL